MISDSGLAFSRYSIVVPKVSPIRIASLNAGITTEKAGNMAEATLDEIEETSSPKNNSAVAIDIDHESAIRLQKTAVHPAGIKRQGDSSVLVDCDEAAAAAKFLRFRQSPLRRLAQ